MKKLLFIFLCSFALANEKLILMDSHGQILSGNGCKASAIASISKLMVSLIVLDKAAEGVISLDDVVQLSWEAAGQLSTGLKKKGRNYKVRELLKSLILLANNTAAEELANFVAIDESFVHMMNKKAHSMGLYNTFFESLTGFGKNLVNSSTPYEVGSIGAALLNHTEYLEILKQSKGYIKTREKIYSLSGAMQEGDVFMMSAAKTKDGFSAVSFKEANGIKLVSVVVNEEFAVNRDKAMINLFSFAAQHFEDLLIGRAGDYVAMLPIESTNEKAKLVLGGDISITLPVNLSVDPIKRLVVPKQLSCPIVEGRQIGVLEVYRNNKIIASQKVVIGESVAATSLLRRIINFFTLGIF